MFGHNLLVTLSLRMRAFVVGVGKPGRAGLQHNQAMSAQRHAGQQADPQANQWPLLEIVAGTNYDELYRGFEAEGFVGDRSWLKGIVRARSEPQEGGQPGQSM